MGIEMRYQASIYLAEKNNSHTLAYDMVQAHAKGSAMRVLEVGCASGYWGAALKKVGHSVVGVEPDRLAATFALKELDHVFVGLVDDYFSENKNEKFDVISFVDVLEHTGDPAGILERCRERLNPGGIVIVSVPNIAHLAVRGMLLAGRWDYAKTGIMDSSHIRFFTRDVLLELFNETAFKILDFKPTRQGAAEVVRNYGMYSPLFLRGLAWLLASDRNWRDFQYVVCACVTEKEDVAALENRRFSERNDFWRATEFKLIFLFKTVVLAAKIMLSTWWRK